MAGLPGMQGFLLRHITAQDNVALDVVPLVPHQEGAEPLSPQETEAAAKQLASSIALALTTHEAGEGADAIAARLPPEAQPYAAALHRPGTWSAGRIIYPQLGGLQPDSASVMVVVEQMWEETDGVHAEWRTLDVRLIRTGGVWQFDTLASNGGDPAAPPAALPPEAVAVLGDPRIELPDSARWDIYRGAVSPKLLALMTRMAEWGDFGVITFSTGHPWEVFGTTRQSDHSRGLAVDIYRLGERLVIDGREPGSAVHQFVEWLYQQPEVRQIGSPWALDGRGGRSFSDALHQDHLHIAVYP